MGERLKLYAPEQYWRLDPRVRAQITNGCGTGGWKGYLVPDTVWGLSIKAACNIHDFMYAAGTTIEEKREADRVFLNNMVRIIDAKSSSAVLKRLRYRRAKSYYEAVEHFGGPAFWQGKNKPQELGDEDLCLQPAFA